MASSTTLFFVVVALALAVAALRAISRRLPALGIVAGFVLCAAPLPLLLSLRDLSFRSDGSAAGAFVPIILGVIAIMSALVAVGLGIQTLQVSWKNFRGEPADWGSMQPHAGDAAREHDAPTENQSGQSAASQQPSSPRENRYNGIFCLVVALLAIGLGIEKLFFGAQYSCMRPPCDFSNAIYARFGSAGVGFFDLVFGLCAAVAGLLFLNNDARKKDAPAVEAETVAPDSPPPLDFLYGVDKALLGMCSNCRRVIKLSNAACPHCHTSPHTNSAWHIEPLLKGERSCDNTDCL